MVSELMVGLLSLAAAGIGAVGGLGGAVLLVPALIVLGMPPVEAAPLGLLTVAAGSLAANASQLEESVVNHRLGVTMELSASAGAIAGALLAGAVAPVVVRWVLALAALGAALAGGLRRGVRNPPDERFEQRHVGEWRYEMGGAYALSRSEVVPYRADRVRRGAAALGVSGLVAGLTGTSGGFIKTPVISELMRVPVKVAAATTVFMVGITASAALTVFAVRGDLDPAAGLAAVLGGLVGGRLGAVLQSRLSPTAVRRFLSVVLVAVAVVLVVGA